MHFQSLLFNPYFLSNFSSSHSPSNSNNLSSFLLLSHPHFARHFPLYDTVSGTWRQTSASFTSTSSVLLSSSNGLLCFHLPTSSSFLITNLLSLSSTLIKFPQLPFNFNHVTFISSSNGGFKLFISISSHIHLYDSKARSWSQFAGYQPIYNDSSRQEGVHINGHLYFTTSDPSSSVVCFSLESGDWSRPFPGPAILAGDLVFTRLVRSCSSEKIMYMVGGVGRYGISRCLKVWELRGNWAEIPDLMYKKLVSVCYHNYEQLYCFWHQGLICVCCYTWPEVLYYKVSSRTWHWLPKCPSIPNKWCCGFRWFSFRPNLCASI